MIRNKYVLYENVVEMGYVECVLNRSSIDEFQICGIQAYFVSSWNQNAIPYGINGKRNDFEYVNIVYFISIYTCVWRRPWTQNDILRLIFEKYATYNNFILCFLVTQNLATTVCSIEITVIEQKITQDYWEKHLRRSLGRDQYDCCLCWT